MCTKLLRSIPVVVLVVVVFNTNPLADLDCQVPSLFVDAASTVSTTIEVDAAWKDDGAAVALAGIWKTTKCSV